jgi:ParB family chromosome partitioning protein
MKTNPPRSEPTKSETRLPLAAPPDERAVARAEVAPADLLPDGDNRTIDEGDEDFQTLVDSVRVMGVLVALQVQRRKDGKFQIWDGERRWRAAQRAGLAAIPCDVWPESTHPRDMLLAGVVINEQRQPHSCLAVARRLRAVKNQFAETHEQVATRTGLSLARVKAYLNLFNASDQLLEFLDEATVPLKTAVELVRYEKAHGEIATRRLLGRHREEPLTARDVENLRKRHDARHRDEQKGPESDAGSKRVTLAARIEAAFRRDANSAWQELQAVATRLGFRVVGEASLPATAGAPRGGSQPGASPGPSAGEPG